MPKTAEINAKIVELASGAPMWLGVEFETTNKFIDGSKIRWSNWLEEYKGTKVCKKIDENGKWVKAKKCASQLPFVCEMTVARASMEGSACPWGDQSKISDPETGEMVTCENIVERYGRGACAGNYPVKKFSELCCKTCRGAVAEASEATAKCPYVEGFFKG